MINIIKFGINFIFCEYLLYFYNKCKLLCGLSYNNTSTDIISNLKRLSDRGDISSSLKIGEIYIRGELVPQHIPSGMFWIKKAATGGHPRAWGLLAKARMSGASLQQTSQIFTYSNKEDVDLREVLAYAQKGMDGGDTESTGIVAQVLMSMNGPSDTEFRAAVIRGARMGHPWSQAVMSQLAADGIPECLWKGMSAHQSAVEWCQRSIAVEIVDPYPYFQAARLVATGIAPGGLPRAKQLMQRAADLGHCEARMQLGCQLLREGDELNGVSYLQKAFWQGDSLVGAHAAAVLGDFYLQSSDPDVSQAVRWYIQAARSKHQGAADMLRSLMSDTKLSAVDSALAQECLRSVLEILG